MALRRRTLLRLLPLLALLGLALAWVLASLDWCGPWPGRPPQVVAQLRGEGALRAGAARVALQPPAEVPGGAGYAPPHPDVGAGALPLHARALVLEVGRARVGLVSLELLSTPPALVDAVRARVAGLGLGGLLVTATHTHSAFGGYDARAAAQLVGMGRFDAELLEVAVRAAAEALTRAAGALEPAQLEVGEALAPERVRTRSGGTEPEGRLLRVVLRGAHAPVAELLVFSAHPTLVPRPVRALDPDWPGRLSQLREAAGAGVSLVLQGAAGNVSAVVPEGDAAPAPEAYARALAPSVEAAALAPVARPTLGFARVQLALPRPDASRLVPGVLERAGDTLLCESSAPLAEVSALSLGSLRLLGLPGEPTVDAGARLRAATGAGTVLGLSDGYVGYVETPEAVAEERGEARRQYFGPELLARLTQAAQAAARAAGF